MNLSRFTPEVIELRQLTLDSLWAEAEKLGSVEVDRSIFKELYEVSIRFRRPSGSLIYAKGEHAAIQVALGAAINEARDLGAGVPQ